MNRLPRLTLVVLLLAVGLASCSSRDDNASSSGIPPSGDEGTSTEQPYEAPVMAAVSAALGADLTDIYKAVLAARRPAVADCVSDSGWTISSTELDELFDPGDSDAGTLTAYIDEIIANFDSAPAPITDPPDRRRIEQIVRCVDQAEARYPNPNSMVLAAIEDFDRDVSARVASDNRVAEAKTVRDECAAHQGVPATDGVEPMAALSGMVTEIQEAVADGSKTIDLATTELRDLQVTVSDVEHCYTTYYVALQAVVDEVQTVELQARPELIPSIVEQTSDLMEQYRALLPDDPD